jgi:hypothetical protein
LSFYLSFLDARRTGLFADHEQVQVELHPCPRCGQPTSSDGLCSFCRMIEKAREKPVRESHQVE